MALTRRYRFPAAHVLASPALGPEENRRVYGRCANPAGHGHDYGVEVTVTGPVDPQRGEIMGRGVLDAIVEEHVLRRFGHRLLNDDPLFRERVPTAENIARAIYEGLEAPIAAAGTARLLGVELQETRRNRFSYGEVR